MVQLSMYISCKGQPSGVGPKPSIVAFYVEEYPHGSIIFGGGPIKCLLQVYPQKLQIPMFLYTYITIILNFFGGAKGQIPTQIPTSSFMKCNHSLRFFFKKNPVLAIL
jgi:hypothetical protein